MKCNTCKALFSSTQKIKDHYRSDWHIFNSKRRTNALPPLRKDDFKLLNADSSLVVKHSPARSSSSVVSAAIQRSPLPSTTVFQGAILASTGNDGAAAIPETPGEKAKAQDEEEKEEQQPATRELPPPLPIGPNISIFDNKEFETRDECVEYMLRKFGFFLPDIEYLQDIDGMLNYLGEKVKLGGYCLYCQKQCIPGRPCQQHMLDSSHCKIAYDDEIDGDEFEDFYDFSADYEDVDDEDLLDEDGNVIENEMQVTALGELQLPNGRTVGHRQFARYYKQRYTAEETRPDVLALQREELLKLGYQLEGHSATQTAVMKNLSDAQVMTMLVKYNKQARKNAIIEQKAQYRAQKAAQRREFVSTKDKLRSSENHTGKIRDYHSMLM